MLLGVVVVAAGGGLCCGALDVWGGRKEYNDSELSPWIPPRPWAAEEGLVLVKESLHKMGVPVAYMQLDDWW